MNVRYFRATGAVLVAAALASVALAQTASTGTGDNPVLTGQPDPPPTVLTPAQRGDPETRRVGGVLFLFELPAGPN